MRERRRTKKCKVTRWERFLTQEVVIEFKACLYFFCILFFYSVFRVLLGEYQASILHMAEMIFTTYCMQYIQVYLLSNFEEDENINLRWVMYSILCSGIYTIVAWFCKWYGEHLPIVLGFLCFMEFAYFCAFLLYRIKRNIDTRILNEDLIAFQGREGKDE